MVSNSEATIKYSVFDTIGRVTTQQTTIAGWVSPFNFGYEYNELDLKKTTYPSGRQVSQEYDAAGRIASVSGTRSGTVTNYVTGVTYAPHGGLSEITVAGGARTEQWCYNNRMQPEAIRLGSAASTGCIAQPGDLLRLSYGYGAAAANNGNISSHTVTRNSAAFTATDTFNYDALNRLKTAGSTGWSQTYVYDRFGNRAVLGTSTIPASGQTPVVSQDTETAVSQIFPSNRWNGGTYDTGGNQLTRFGGQFQYDAENRLVQATTGTTVTFAYDGEGRRVKKGGTAYVYDAFGQLAAEYGGTSSLSGTRYLTADHLGSTRLVTDALVEASSVRTTSPSERNCKRELAAARLVTAVRLSLLRSLPPRSGMGRRASTTSGRGTCPPRRGGLRARMLRLLTRSLKTRKAGTCIPRSRGNRPTGSPSISKRTRPVRGNRTHRTARPCRIPVRGKPKMSRPIPLLTLWKIGLLAVVSVGTMTLFSCKAVDDLRPQRGIVHVSLGAAGSGPEVYFKREVRGLSYDVLWISAQQDPCAPAAPKKDLIFNAQGPHAVFYKIEAGKLIVYSASPVTPATEGQLSVLVESHVLSATDFNSLRSGYNGMGLTKVDVPLNTSPQPCG
jgi:YD repeat-containing protein